MGATVSAARKSIEAVQVLKGLTPHQTVTGAQRASLESFPGWGAAAPMFDPTPTGSWASLIDDLQDTIGEQAVTDAGRVVDTAFYTPPQLIAHMYYLLQTAGFTGGQVLDLGCGTARFLSHAPAGMPIDYTGVEIDPTTAAIANALHPAANILAARLQDVSLRRTQFDVAIGNIPFSAASVHDPVFPFYGSLHHYFLTRAVDAVRPGGYVVVVTSRHALDNDGGLPDSIDSRADLLAAVRLPSGYFSSEGTDVVSDVVILQVRGKNAPRGGWVADEDTQGHHLWSDDRRSYGSRVSVSALWAQRPQLVAGEMRATGYSQNPVEVVSGDKAQSVAAAFAAAEQYLRPYQNAAAGADFSDVQLTDAAGRPEGSFHVVEGVVARIVQGRLAPVSRPGRELTTLICLRDSVSALVAAEADWDTPDETLSPLRTACADLYRKYVARFGPLNRGELTTGKVDPETGIAKLGWKTPTMGGFRRDPGAPLTFSIEKYDQATGAAEPAAILLQRVNRRPQPVTSADSPGDALAVSLGEGGLDLRRIADLLSLPTAEAAFQALGDLVYRDPSTGAAVSARDYLSGNVRAKLVSARATAAVDPEYGRNVTALEAVQPHWLGRTEVRVELGSPFITATDVQQFCRDVFGRSAGVDHVAPLAAWEVRPAAADPAARIAYGTQRRSPYELLQAGLNGASPVVTDPVYDPVTRKHRDVRNHRDTEAAEQALAAIGERFSLWVWEDAARERRILNDYNNTMNAHVLRVDDGSHLTFPGLAAGQELWPWQAAFVDRAVSMGGAFAAHEPGLGKTRTMLALAMTLRQFGIANRPALSVPSHLIEQITREAYQTFPAAKLLVVTRDDLTRDNRRLFAARCVTGDWDCVIFTHEGLGSIPVPAKAEKDWLEEQLHELERYSRSQGHVAKQIARAVRSLEGKIEKLRHNSNDPQTVTFDQLGIDYLAVDEVDKFRRLHVATRADGFSLGSSIRAMDLFLKVSMLRNRAPDRPHVSFFTGTPFTNSLAECFVWTRFMAPQRLHELGLNHFDAWAAQFIRYALIVEVAPDGSGFRSKRRPAVIQNVPELRTQIGGFMSIVRAADTNLTRPTPHQHTVTVEPTDGTDAFMQTLVDRADDLRGGLTPRGADNMLVICSDGRKVALDPNLVGVNDEAPKVSAVAAEVARIYRETEANIYPNGPTPGAFQLVMCDLGTPHPGDNQTYGRLRNAMIKQGIPDGKIRFIHDATSPKSSEALFAGCRDGSIAVLIASTPKAGVGTNIQDRLHSIHHVDPTWHAAAWEQRNGRGIRYGNLHSDVDLYAYATEGTFDAFMFGLNERKAAGFAQLYRSDSEVREIDDIGDGALNFGQLKAAASGNSDLLRQHELRTTVRALKLARTTYYQNTSAADDAANTAERDAKRLQRTQQVLTELNDYTPFLGPLDLADLADYATGGRRSHKFLWSSGPLAVSFTTQHDCLWLAASFDRHTLGKEPLPAKVQRKGPDRVQKWSERLVKEWLTAATTKLATIGDVIDRRYAEAAEARAAATAVTFDGADELADAEAQLAALDQLIEAASQQKGTQTAA